MVRDVVKRIVQWKLQQDALARYIGRIDEDDTNIRKDGIEYGE